MATRHELQRLRADEAPSSPLELRRRADHITSMARLGSWIEPHPEGIYIPAADAWIDPSQPKPRALVTHGHADHARGGHGAVLATPGTLAIMETRYGPQNGQAVAYGESDPARRRRRPLRARRPCPRLGADRAGARRRARRRLGRLQAPPRSHLRAVRAGAVRHLRHRGDVRPARLPPPRYRRRDRPAAGRAPRQPRSLRAGRRLCAGQGAAGDRRAARARPPRSDLHPRRDGAAVRALSGARRRSRRAASRRPG